MDDSAGGSAGAVPMPERGWPTPKLTIMCPVYNEEEVIPLFLRRMLPVMQQLSGRYDVDLPCYGYYWGAGLQYRDILPKWDLSLDWREHYKMGRDKTVLPNDPPSTPERTRMFFDVNSYALYLSRRF